MESTLLGWLLFTGFPTSIIGMIAVQTLLATLLFTLVGIAYHRRRSLPYLLVWLATSTLLAESLFGIAGLAVPFSPLTHLLVDYVLDIVLVVTVLAAVYSARRLDSPDRTTHDSV